MRTGRRRGGARRALSLFEVVVALALLVALGALALPNLAHLADRQRLDTTVDEVVGQMMLARARAQSDGEMVELVFLPRSGRFEVRGLGRRSDAPISIGTSGDDAPRRLEESWAVRTIDPAIRVEVGDCAADPIADDASDDDEPVDRVANAADSAMQRSPAAESARTAASASASQSSRSGRSGTGRVGTGPDRGAASGAGTGTGWSERPGDADDAPTRVAVFAGDGSAIVAGCCRFEDETGRVVVIAVNPWTGLPAVDRSSASPAPDGRADADDFDAWP